MPCFTLQLTELLFQPQLTVGALDRGDALDPFLPQHFLAHIEALQEDPHPRLLLEGEGVHAGQGFTALFPDGWHDITLEVAWEPEGPGCWYISTPGFKGVCPIGLFVKV